MKLMVRLSFLLYVFCLGQRANAQELPFRWVLLDNNTTYNINPAYPRHILACKNGTNFWGYLKNIKINYGQQSYGDYQLGVYDGLGVPGPNTVPLVGKMYLVDAQADPVGNWYVLGTYYDTVTFSNGARLVRDPNANDASYFMFRLDANTLALRWLKTIGGNNHCEVNCFSLQNNSIYLPMDSTGSTDIRKYDINTGNSSVLLSQKGASHTSSIQVDAAGNLYLAGSCADPNILFNNTHGSAPSTYQYPEYIVRYKASGQHDWHLWTGEGTCVPRKLSLVNNNFFYYCGELYDSITLSSHHFSRNGVLGMDYLLARMDSLGKIVWAQQQLVTSAPQGQVIISNAFHGAVKDSTFLLFCQTKDNINWGNGVNTSANSASNATLVSFGANGAAQWGKVIKGKYSSAQHIAAEAGAILITGNGADSTALNFDSLAVSANPIYAGYLSLLKAAPNGVNNISMVPPINISPNPATSELYITGLDAWNSGVHIRVTDMMGREVMQAMTASGKDATTLRTAQLSRGIYLLHLYNEQYRSVQKIILQ